VRDNNIVRWLRHMERKNLYILYYTVISPPLKLNIMDNEDTKAIRKRFI